MEAEGFLLELEDEDGVAFLDEDAEDGVVFLAEEVEALGMSSSTSSSSDPTAGS